MAFHLAAGGWRRTPGGCWTCAASGCWTGQGLGADGSGTVGVTGFPPLSSAVWGAPPLEMPLLAACDVRCPEWGEQDRPPYRLLSERGVAPGAGRGRFWKGLGCWSPGRNGAAGKKSSGKLCLPVSKGLDLPLGRHFHAAVCGSVGPAGWCGLSAAAPFAKP